MDMSAAEGMEWIAAASPRAKARTAGAFWLMTILTGGLSLLLGGRWGTAANLIATACYAVATLLVYVLLKPVNRSLSLLGAVFSLVGCSVSALILFRLAPSLINPLVFFGLQCLLVGYLVFRSTFLPRVLGVLLALGGFGWLTFLSPALASHLFPYNLAPGMIGEGSLSLWLIVKGVNIQKWEEQASA
jgi:Domain of unknown function (DUF4386)